MGRRGRASATRHAANIDLWTARYDGTALVSPRRVARVPEQEDGAVGGGYYVHSENDAIDPSNSHFVFYRLSDGARAIIDTGDLPANGVLWVSEREAIVDAFGQKYRIDPSTLTFE